MQNFGSTLQPMTLFVHLVVFVCCLLVLRVFVCLLVLLVFVCLLVLVAMRFYCYCAS